MQGRAGVTNSQSETPEHCRCANDGNYGRAAMELLAWDLSAGTPWRQATSPPPLALPSPTEDMEEEEEEEDGRRVYVVSVQCWLLARCPVAAYWAGMAESKASRAAER